MHIIALAKRDAEARERIAQAVKRLAGIFDLDNTITLTVQEKDTAVKAMREREATADFLESILAQIEAQENDTLGPVAIPPLELVGEDGAVTKISVSVDGAPVAGQIEETTESQPIEDTLGFLSLPDQNGEPVELAAFSEDGQTLLGVLAEEEAPVSMETDVVLSEDGPGVSIETPPMVEQAASMTEQTTEIEETTLPPSIEDFDLPAPVVNTSVPADSSAQDDQKAKRSRKRHS